MAQDGQEITLHPSGEVAVLRKRADGNWGVCPPLSAPCLSRIFSPFDNFSLLHCGRCRECKSLTRYQTV
jgi:hypothetical protein